MFRALVLASLIVISTACQSRGLDVVTGPQDIADGAAAPKRKGKGVVESLSQNSFRIGPTIPSGTFVEQSRPDLCWAACIESLERASNPRTARPQIELARLAGDVGGDAPGDYFVVQLMLAPSYVDDCQKRGVRSLKPRLLPTSEFIDALLEGRPLIVGIQDPQTKTGHTLLAWSAVIRPRRRDRMEFLSGKSSRSDWLLESITLWDPSPGAGNVTMSGQDLSDRIVFFSTQETARKSLQEALRARR